MRISDWSSDVCSSDLLDFRVGVIISAFALKLDGERLIDFFRHGRSRGDARLNEISHDPAIGDDLSLIFGQRIFGRKAIKRLQPETAAKRSEERRVGQEGVSACRYRWWRYHRQKKRYEKDI